MTDEFFPLNRDGVLLGEKDHFRSLRLSSTAPGSQPSLFDPSPDRVKSLVSTPCHRAGYICPVPPAKDPWRKNGKAGNSCDFDQPG
jgi:hypothetical protein